MAGLWRRLVWLFEVEVEVSLDEDGVGFVVLLLLFVGASVSSGGPRRGQISSASKRESSRVRLGAWSVREPERGPVPLSFVPLPLGARDGGRGELGPIGRCGAKRRLT
jgi:hypothetical protein